MVNQNEAYPMTVNSNVFLKFTSLKSICIVCECLYQILQIEPLLSIYSVRCQIFYSSFHIACFNTCDIKLKNIISHVYSMILRFGFVLPFLTSPIIYLKISTSKPLNVIIPSESPPYFLP